MAFQTLKRRFSEEPVLMIPDPTRPFQIETDASKHATGAVLTQTDGNRDRHPCASFPKPSLQLNEITKSTIGNS